MRFRIAALVVLAAWLPRASAQPQTAAEQLQKGVYAQQTTGDLDAAIQIYRQIVSSFPTPRAVAAQAQYRLFQALVQKGDLNGAQMEFQNLVLNYSDYRELIMSMAGRMRSGSNGPSVTLGTVQNGRYHHKITGVEFNTPSGWILQGDSDSSDGGEIVMFVQPKAGLTLAVWIRPDATSTANIAAALRHDVDRKHEDRPAGWTVRPSSIQVRNMGGYQALTAVADFRADVQGETMVEYLTWVRSTKSKAFFFASGRSAEFPALQSAVEQMLASTLVP